MNRATAVCIVVLLALSGRTASAQGPVRIERASARVEISSSHDDAIVTTTWDLMVPVDANDLVVRAIPFFDLVPDGVVVVANGRASPIALAGVRGAYEAPLDIPPGRVTVEVRYHVTGAVLRTGDRGDVRLPLLLVAGEPAASMDDFFIAELLAPAGTTVTGGFPTVPVDHGRVDGGELFALQLQVVPSMLRWRTARGDPPLVSFDTAVDLALLLVLASLGVLGVRALRKSA